MEEQNIRPEQNITSEQNTLEEIKSFPKIMGILNITPDSFSDGGSYTNIDAAIKHALKMIDDGVDIIDIGGESTRPGANRLPAEEEIDRIIPVVAKIHEIEPNIPISIDTTKSKVAEEALRVGASIINDVTGLTDDPALAEVCAKYDAELVVMHIKGEPRNMQEAPQYDDVVAEVFEFLQKQIKFAESKGVKKIYSDIGIGFGKTVDHNLELLRNIDAFEKLGKPMLLGISRKSFIGRILNIDRPSERDTATALLHSLLLTKNIDIIRVHNVRLHSQLRDLFYELY